MTERPSDWPSPFLAGIRGRCPRCGDGRLFAGVLNLADECSNCGLKYDFADSGDGPAVFVIMILGFVVLGAVLWVEFTYEPSLWFHILFWLPATALLCIGLLRPMKATLIALQFQKSAREGRLDDA